MGMKVTTTTGWLKLK